MAASAARDRAHHRGSQGTLFLNGSESGTDIQITGSETRGVGFITFSAPALDSLAIHLELKPSLSTSTAKAGNQGAISFQFVHKGMRVSKGSNVKPIIKEPPHLKTSKSEAQLRKRPSLPMREAALLSATSARSAPTPVVAPMGLPRQRTLSTVNGNLMVTEYASSSNSRPSTRPSTRASNYDRRNRSRSISSQPKSSGESTRVLQHPPLPAALVRRVSSERALSSANSVPTLKTLAKKVSF